MSEYDGTSKALRPQCESCRYYAAGPRAQHILAHVRFPRGSIPFDASPRFCLWGVAIKVLDNTLLRRRCGFANQPGPGEERLRHLGLAEAAPVAPRP